eukprot:gene4645-biopygen8773
MMMQPTHRTLIVILAIAAGWYVYWKTFKQLKERVDDAEQREQSAEQRAQSSDKLILSERKRAEELLVSERKRAEKLLVSERKRADDAVRQLRCMGDKLELDVQMFLRGIGLTKQALAASHYATTMEYEPYMLCTQASPGDHIAVWSDSKGYWHHGIFAGTSEHGHAHVLDIMPDGLARRPLGLFIKGADSGAVLVYKDALPLDYSLKLAQYLVEQGSVVEYNLVEENCDKFSATCRLGRPCESEQIHKIAERLAAIAKMDLPDMTYSGRNITDALLPVAAARRTLT